MKVLVSLILAFTCVFGQSINLSQFDQTQTNSPPKKTFFNDSRFKYPVIIGLSSTIILGSIGYGLGLIEGINDMQSYRYLHGIRGALIGGSVGLVVGIPIGLIVGAKKHKNGLSE